MSGSAFVKISSILAKSNGNLYFECPACEIPHGINCGEGHGAMWQWDGNKEKPTFSPSLLVTYSHGDKNFVCHSFVRNGKIEYLSDCTHDMAGKTVDIPKFNVACE